MKSTLLPHFFLSLLLVSQAVAGTSTPALAELAPASTPSDWWGKADVYGWAQSLDGDVSIRGVSLPVEVGFDDILENLDIAAMGAIEIGRGPWSFMADVVYAKLEGESSTARGLLTGRFEQKQLLGNFVACYQIARTESTHLGVYGGIRLNSIDVNLDLPGSVLDRSTDESWVDPIIGVRYQTQIAPAWFFRAVGDVGGFGVASDFTWQAMAGIGWNLSDQSTLLLGYRGLGTDYSDGGFSYDVIAHGPVIGFEYRF